jgi:hypothetical protein
VEGLVSVHGVARYCVETLYMCALNEITKRVESSLESVTRLKTRLSCDCDEFLLLKISLTFRYITYNFASC